MSTLRLILVYLCNLMFYVNIGDSNTGPIAGEDIIQRSRRRYTYIFLNVLLIFEITNNVYFPTELAIYRCTRVDLYLF